MISVIVPIYNVESYLEECLKSITGQTYAELEIILVNDGSTDACGRICDKWQKLDERICVIHKENGGLSSARNAGLTLAKGEYISFVDSDDFIHPQMYERMLSVQSVSDADMVICREYAFADGEDAPYEMQSGKPVYGIENRVQLLEHFCDDFSGLVTWAWNKLYKKELLEGILFERDTIQEDILFAVSVATRVTKVARMDERLYFYRQRRDSIMNRKNPQRLWQCALVTEKQFHLLHNVMDKTMHVKLYHTMLGRVADYAAASFWKKEEQLGDIEEIFRRLYDNIGLRKRVKFRIIRFCPRFYYWLKGTRKCHFE